MVSIDLDALHDPIIARISGRLDLRVHAEARGRVLEAVTIAETLAPHRMRSTVLKARSSEARDFSAASFEHAFKSSGVLLGIVLERPGVRWSLDFVPEQKGVGTVLRLELVRPFDAAIEDVPHALASYCNAVHVRFAVADYLSYLHLHGEKLLGDPWAKPHFGEVYWLNAYPMELVDTIGRDCALAAPAAAVMELADGAVMILTSPSPGTPTAAETLEAKARLRCHLRGDLSHVQELERLTQKVLPLAPVECDWDPLIEDMLLELVRSSGGLDGMRLAHRMKAFRPPRVAEQAPLTRCKPSDVQDPDSQLSEYQDLAEAIVALFQREYRKIRPPPEIVRLLAERDPAVLPQLDVELWRANYSEFMDAPQLQEMLIPGLGAYVGELVARHLGGRWVPTAKRSDSQIVAGGRVWYPFRRAERCVQTKKATLKYSLTQFYRTIERTVADHSDGGPDEGRR